MIFIDFFMYIIYQVLNLYKYSVIVYVIISMLISFNVININNQFISMIMNFLFKLVEPSLRIIRRIIPNFGSIDITPVILIILIESILYIITKYSF
jgi:YggT family protein